MIILLNLFILLTQFARKERLLAKGSVLYDFIVLTDVSGQKNKGGIFYFPKNRKNEFIAILVPPILHPRATYQS